MLRSGLVRIVLVFGVLLLVVAPGVAAQERLDIATGGTGGVYYPYGGGLANLLNDELEDYDFTATVTSASVDNMYLVGDGEAALAFVLADTAYDAAQGNAPFEEPIDAMALVTLYNNYTQIVVSPGAEIESVEDLAGKRVSTGSPGSGTEVIALRVMEVAGVAVDDIEQEQLGAAESADAFRDGQIDAFFWSGGLPTGAITDLAASNVEMELLSHGDVLDGMREQYGDFYDVAMIPAETYPNQTEEVESIVVPNLLVVSGDFDDQLGYDIVRIMFEQQEQLIAVHPEAQNLSLETAMSSQALPYHPGAMRYLEEQGVGGTPAAVPAGTPAG